MTEEEAKNGITRTHIFIDRYTGRTHVAYKRNDGGYGILIVMHDYQ